MLQPPLVRAGLSPHNRTIQPGKLKTAIIRFDQRQHPDNIAAVLH